MKVFVVTSHLEYEGNTPETWVEGVFDTKEKATKVMEEVFAKQLELNWGNIEEEDREYNEYEKDKKRSVYDTCNSNFACIEIWEREVE